MSPGAVRSAAHRVAAHLASSGHALHAVRVRGLASRLAHGPQGPLLDQLVALCDDVADLPILGCAPPVWQQRVDGLRRACRQTKAAVPARR